MQRMGIRALCGVAVVVAELVASAQGVTELRAQDQAAERLPSFEVASVKENRSGESRTRMVTQPGGSWPRTCC